MSTNDTVYVLSATNNYASKGGNMYVKGPGAINPNTLDEIVTELHEAKLFDTEEAAWYYREHNTASGGWQITPFSKKRIFKDKLTGL